ncbi:calcium channel protein [Mortierella alpina]|nr:calcium channel protein [Mortierella alpina]
MTGHPHTDRPNAHDTEQAPAHAESTQTHAAAAPALHLPRVNHEAALLPSPELSSQQQTAFSPTSHISIHSPDHGSLSADPFFDPVPAEPSSDNEAGLRRRRHASFTVDGHSSSLAPRSQSVVSRSSTSSTRERAPVRPASPTLVPAGSKRTSIVRNRSSVVGPPASPGTEQPGSWMHGLSDVMTGISSRVVNSRAQEQQPSRSSVHSQADHSDGEQADLARQHRNSYHQEGSASAVSYKVLGAGSEHGSTKLERVTGSKRSSGGGGSNLATRSPQHGTRGLFKSAEQSRSGGSHLGKSHSAVHEKGLQDEGEPSFAPGGFAHRAGDKIRLEGRSLLIFSPSNPLRIQLASVLMSKYTDPFILVVILTQWVFFVITPTTEDVKNSFGSYWTHYGLLAINILYTIEIISKAIVYGLFFDRNGFQWRKRVPSWMLSLFGIFSITKTSRTPFKRSLSLSRVTSAHSHSSMTEKSDMQINSACAQTMEGASVKASESSASPAHAPFFRSYYNRLDGIVVVSYWIDFAFMLTGVERVYIFKAISALRPLRLLSLTEGTSTIIDSLSMSAPLLLTILGFIFFFFLILSLIGLLVFQGSLSRRCAIKDPVDVNTWSPVTPEMVCGGYFLNGTVQGIVNYVGQGDGDNSSPRTSGLICPEGQVCMQFPNYNPLGLVSFDNFLFSLLTVFTVSSLEGWTDVEYWVMDGDSRWAAIFFCVAIFLMSFLMIPLFIAGITYSFGAVRAEKRHSAFSSKPQSKRTLLDTAEGWQFDDQIHQVRSPARQWLIRLVNDPWFPIAGAVVVFFNLLTMCFRRYDSTSAELERLNIAEIVFTFFFLLEIGVRIAGHSVWKLFWKRKSNQFDLFLALTTTTILLPVIQEWEWYRYLTVFQVMRAYRLIPAIPGVRDLMRAIIGSATGMMNLLLITFMFLLVCAPIPMFLFGGDMVSDEDQPILTGENWVNIMYEGLEAHQERYKQFYAAIFFVVYYCASHYVLLNLFIAIVLEHFELDDDEKYRKQLEMYFERHQRLKNSKTHGIFQYLNPYAYLPARPQTLSVHGLPMDQTVVVRKNIFREFLEGDNAPNTSEIVESKGRIILWLERARDYWFPTQAQLEAAQDAKMPVKTIKVDQNQLLAGRSGFGKTQDEIDASLERLDAGLEKITWDMDRPLEDTQATSETLSLEGYRRAKAQANAFGDEKATETREFLEAHPMFDRALFLFPSNNRFRQWCRRLVGPRTGRHLGTMNWFNWLIFACIILSIAVVIADDPVDRQRAMLTGDARTINILSDIDYATTIIFVVEQFLRVLAYGLVFTPTGYLRDLWNSLDLFIVLMSCVMVFAQIDHLYSVSRAVRALSCLRVLRLVRYFEGVSAMFRAIAKALPRMVVALVLTALLFWPFAIYGVNIYAGYFYSCNDNNIPTKGDCIGEFMKKPDGNDDVGILIPRTWRNPYDYSFDTIQAAVLTLFEMASAEGWILVMNSGRAVPNHLGEQPFFQTDEPNRFNSFYFLLFMLIGSIVFVQVFIGVILETFKAWNGISLLTVEQRRWLDLRRQLRLIKPTATPARPQNWFRAICYDMVIEKKGILWKVMTAILALNVCLIASQHYDQPLLLTDIQDISYFIFLGLYTVEIAIKLCGYGFHKWRLSRWNLYDFVITTLALITLIPRFIGHQLWTLRLEKFLLITISFRLAQRIDSLQVLFRALVIALGSIINITAVFMVVFTVYAITFRELFGMTRLGPSTTATANFETFGNTMLMLIRMTTGENWDFVMHDMMVEWPLCTPSMTSYLDSDCGSQPWAYFMFLSFYIVCTYILLNMFIAVIISNFSFAYQQDSLTTLITREDLRNFKVIWAEFDPRGTGYFDPKFLSKFLRSLEGRFCTRVYADPEYSVPNLVKTFTVSPGPPGPAASSTTEDLGNPNAPPSPSLHGGSSTNRSVFGLGSARRLSRLSVTPSGRHGGGHSPKTVSITVSGPESSQSDEKKHVLEANLDLQGLQQSLSRVDTLDVYRRRRIYNLVYKEAMATCTTRGISFYSILDILSFTLVDIEQALGMDEFLKRNDRVKEIKAAVARETIHNLLMTIVARRSFLKQRRSKQSSRLRPEVPRIVIDTSIGNELRSSRQDTSPMLTSSPTGRSSFLPSPLLDFSKGHSNFHSDEDISPLGGVSTNTMLSISSNDSNGWDFYERDSFNRLSGQSDSVDFMSEQRPGSPQSGFAVEGATWFNMLQDQIKEQDEAHITGQHP